MEKDHEHRIAQGRSHSLDALYPALQRETLFSFDGEDQDIIPDLRFVEDIHAKEEASHFVDVYQSFEGYSRDTFKCFREHESSMEKVNPMYKTVLEAIGVPSNLRAVKECIHKNHEFLHRVLDTSECFFSNAIVDEMENRARNSQDPVLSQHDMEKVRSTMRQFVRDWTSEGMQERAQSYGTVLNALDRLYPDHRNRHNIKVLNPGCGLGRLPWEIANLGFCSQGNEFSYFMLIASNFVLNHVDQENSFQLYPFVHQTNNVVHFQDQVRPVFFPDVSPSSLRNHNFSMVAGDFIEVYGNQPDAWDCVVTCFFIDTSRNVLQLVETISRILKSGGYWINLGPLLYHYSEMQNELSIELPYSDLRKCYPLYGFRIIEEQADIRCPYTCNQRSMFEMTYKCAFSVCQRI